VIDENIYNDFLTVYSELIEDDIFYSLAEKSLKIGPILVDID